MERIKRPGINSVYVLLLKCYDYWHSEPKMISEEDFVKLLKTVENFLVRRFVCRLDTRDLPEFSPHYAAK